MSVRPCNESCICAKMLAAVPLLTWRSTAAPSVKTAYINRKGTVSVIRLSNNSSPVGQQPS